MNNRINLMKNIEILFVLFMNLFYKLRLILNKQVFFKAFRMYPRMSFKRRQINSSIYVL